jgi:hypothetical protein
LKPKKKKKKKENPILNELIDFNQFPMHDLNPDKIKLKIYRLLIFKILSFISIGRPLMTSHHLGRLFDVLSLAIVHESVEGGGAIKRNIN